MRPTCASKASMLISLMPGEQHSLGAKMLRAFFSKAHWDVVLLQPKSLQAIIDELLVCQPNLISITVTQIESLDQIKNLIKLVRQQVSLRTTPWMIGGRVINDHLPQAQAVLTDRHIHFCQGDAKQALALANRLLGLDSTTQQSGSMGSTATQH
jgi:methanogenic corrinoid protein MtbC1